MAVNADSLHIVHFFCAADNLTGLAQWQAKFGVKLPSLYELMGMGFDSGRHPKQHLDRLLKLLSQKLQPLQLPFTVDDDTAYLVAKRHFQLGLVFIAPMKADTGRIKTTFHSRIEFSA